MIVRPHSPALDAQLGQEIPVLDHGFIRVVDYMGNDDAIVQAARVSYGTGTKSVSDDRSLIRYLLRNRHTTPFEMAEIKLHVKLPIFVARQWIRHRTASVNEYSARYSVLDREFYLPTPQQVAPQSIDNKQGRGAPIDASGAAQAISAMSDSAHRAYDTYTALLANSESDEGAEQEGIARELARTVLPVSFYTQWYWKVDLHNLLHFLQLRADPHAQFEIRQYAEAILSVVRAWVPLTYEAFIDYRSEAVQFSGPALKVIQALLSGEDMDQESSGLGKREWRELFATLKRPLP